MSVIGVELNSLLDIRDNKKSSTHEFMVTMVPWSNVFHTLFYQHHGSMVVDVEVHVSHGLLIFYFVFYILKFELGFPQANGPHIFSPPCYNDW